MPGQRLEEEVLNFDKLTSLLEERCENPTTMEFRPWADSPPSHFNIYPLPPSPEDGQANYFAVRESTLIRGTVGTARLLEASSPGEAAQKLRAAIWNINDSTRGEKLGFLAVGGIVAALAAPYAIVSPAIFAIVLGGLTVITAPMLGSFYVTRLIDRANTRRAVSAVFGYL